MKLYISIPALVAAGLLSACSSNSTTPAQIDAGIALLESVVDGDVTEVSADDLPDNASMTGYLAATNDGDTVYVGDAAVDFNFQSSTLSGDVTNVNAYELADACDDGFEDCTGEQTQSLDGSLTILGGIDETEFYYDAQGQLTTEDDDLGSVTANVYLGGEGEIGELDGNLVAVGEGGGGVDVFTAEDGYVGGGELDNILVLSE